MVDGEKTRNRANYPNQENPVFISTFGSSTNFDFFFSQKSHLEVNRENFADLTFMSFFNSEEGQIIIINIR